MQKLELGNFIEILRENSSNPLGFQTGRGRKGIVSVDTGANIFYLILRDFSIHRKYEVEDSTFSSMIAVLLKMLEEGISLYVFECVEEMLEWTQDPKIRRPKPEPPKPIVINEGLGVQYSSVEDGDVVDR